MSSDSEPYAKRAKGVGSSGDCNTDDQDGTDHERVFLRFTNCQLVKGDVLVREDLWVLDGRIINPLARWLRCATSAQFLSPRVVDCGGNILAPGFVDLQINGAFGVDFANPADVTLER